MGDNAILELLIRAKDEATQTLQGVGKQVDDVAKKAGDFSKTMKLAGGILTGVGVAGVAVMSDWVKSAGEAQVEMAKVDAIVNAVANGNKTAFANIKRYVNEASEAYIKLGFDDETTALSFTKLFQATMDTNEANKLLALSADLARYKGVDLETATIAVMKATQGSTKELKAMGLEVKDGATAQQNLATIQKTVAGQAKAYGETYAGSMERMSVVTSNLKEALGERLLPMVVQFVTKLTDFINKINNVNPKFLDLAVKVVAVATAFSLIVGPILMFIGFLPMISAGIAVLSGVLLPAIGVILAIVAVVTAVYLAFKNWDQIVLFVNNVWNSIKAFVAGVIADLTLFFANLWASIVNFFTPVVAFITAYLNMVWTVWSYIFNTIFTLVSFIFQGIWSLIQIVFWAIYGFIQMILNALWSVFGERLTAIWNFIVTIFNTVKDYIAEVWGAISSYIGAILTKVGGTFSEKFNAISTTIKTIISEVFNWFGDKLDKVWDKVTSITGLIKDAFSRMANGIMEALRQIKFPHLSIGSGSVNVGGKEISYPKLNVDWYEQGGWVKNTGLAVVHQGEFVLSKNMLQGRTPVPGNVSNYQQPITINAVINTPVDFDLLSYKLAYQLRNN